MVAKEGKVVEGIASPVITICSKKSKNLNGWKVIPDISISFE